MTKTRKVVTFDGDEYRCLRAALLAARRHLEDTVSFAHDPLVDREKRLVDVDYSATRALHEIVSLLETIPN